MRVLKEWEKIGKELNERFDELRVLGFVHDSPFGETVCKMFDKYTEVLAESTGMGDWLSWYAWENNFGAKGMQAGVDDDMNPITRIEELMEVARCI